MIQSRRRHRRPSPQFASERGRVLPKLVVPVLVLMVVVWLAYALVQFLSPVARGQRVATLLAVSDRGRVEVSIGGGQVPQRAESGLRLYEGDRVAVSAGAQAELMFFDGTKVIVDSGAKVLLGEVAQGIEESLIELTVEDGDVFVASSATGAVIRRVINTTNAIYELPRSTQAIVGAHAYVFSTSGPGIDARVKLSSRTAVEVIVGEGQQLIMDATVLAAVREQGEDPYTLRGALDNAILSSPLYLAAIQQPEVVVEDVPDLPDREKLPLQEEEQEQEPGDLLLVEEPEDGAVLKGDTVLVRGRAGSRITKVNVNGYSAELNAGVFQKEIALPEEEEFTVTIVGEDRDGLVIKETSLALAHDIQPPDPPTILEPAGSGAMVQINEDTFEIVGTSSPDTTGIVVNGYQLQRFKPGKGEWRYLVDGKLGNIRVGENTYEIIAVDRAGNRSLPVSITIVWKAQAVEEEEVRSDGAYLQPGTLKVNAPTADGLPYVTEEDEVLIEGETSNDTYSISVNGFTLSLYVPEKTTWNYIASEKYGNYRQGVNRFTVVARDNEGKILDVLRYLIEKQ